MCCVRLSATSMACAMFLTVAVRSFGADTRPDDRGDWFRDPPATHPDASDNGRGVGLDRDRDYSRGDFDDRDARDRDGRDRDGRDRDSRDRVGSDRDWRDRDGRDPEPRDDWRGRDMREPRDRRDRGYDEAPLGSQPPRSPYGGYDEYGSYPSYDVRDWVIATARAATARAMLRRAENELDAAVRRAQHDFERSRNYRQAVASERSAYDNYLSARSHALRDLADNDRYQSLIHLRDELGEKLAQRRAARDISKDEVLAIARLKMDYASQARSMEVEALNSDNALKDARDHMVTASKRVSDMEEDFDESIRENSSILMARRNLEDARISVITAQTYANSAAAAGGSAIDYAYYLHRNDIQRWDTGGYGSPYWARY